MYAHIFTLYTHLKWCWLYNKYIVFFYVCAPTLPNTTESLSFSCFIKKRRRVGDTHIIPQLIFFSHSVAPPPLPSSLISLAAVAAAVLELQLLLFGGCCC